jgi:hypothetical protein
MMINSNSLSILLCSIKLLIGDGEWAKQDCKVRAEEFVTSANKYKLDPLLLVAISTYECDLADYKDVIYSSSRGIEARDICPMGLHVKFNLHETRAGLGRQDVIKISADLLAHYKKYHNKHCKHANHYYLQHYNTGYNKFDNGYAANVLEIYTALKTGKSTLRKVSPRTQEIALNIRKALGNVKHQSIYKDCHPSNHCILASKR